MSIRLNVVLSQSTLLPPASQDMEGELVIALMGIAGMDLSLIGPLQRLGHHPTDRLVLESIAGDVAILCWCAPEEGCRLVAEAGIPGRRSPHPMDPQATDPQAPTGPNGRRLYFIDMRDESAETLTAALRGLLASRQTVTYALAAPGELPRRPPAPATIPAPAIIPKVTRGTSTSPDAGASQDAAGATANSRVANLRAADLPEPSDRWDSLVDELNASDI